MARPNYDEAINAIYRAAFDPVLWPDALSTMVDFVGGIGAIIVHNDYRTGRGDILQSRLREDLGELYLERHCGNPIVRAAETRAEIGKVSLGSHLVDPAAIRRTEFHADILVPQKIADQLLLPLATLSSGSTPGGFAIMLDPYQAEDGAMAADRLGQLAPHVSNAFDLSLEISRHKDEAARLGTLLDAMPSAAILLNQKARIVQANCAAEALLSRGEGLTAGREMTLRAALPGEDRRLQRAISAMLNSWADGSAIEQALSIGQTGGSPSLLLILTRLPPAEYRFSDIAEGRATLLVRIIDPAQRDYERSDLLLTAYNLTPAEARVATLIAMGHSAPAAAQLLGISAATVRTHLARTFDKTGAHSQVALTRLVGALGQSPTRARD